MVKVLLETWPSERYTRGCLLLKHCSQMHDSGGGDVGAIQWNTSQEKNKSVMFHVMLSNNVMQDSIVSMEHWRMRVCQTCVHKAVECFKMMMSHSASAPFSFYFLWKNPIIEACLVPLLAGGVDFFWLFFSSLSFLPDLNIVRAGVGLPAWASSSVSE